MRRHATASSSRSKARKPSGSGSSLSSRRLRLSILLATVAAFLLIPAAQAFAGGGNVNGNLTIVKIVGEGEGEVSSLGGSTEFGGFFEGNPAIECSYNGTSSSGNCEAELEEVEEFGELIAIHTVAAPGSELTALEVTLGNGINLPSGAGERCAEYVAQHDTECVINNSGSGNAEVLAEFSPAGPSGPTNRVNLTLTKSAGGTGGTGAISSKPKGINCGAACNSAVASMYKNTPVVLKEKPSTGSTFVEWTGACSGSTETCTVPMAEAESVGAVFGGTSKEILNPQALTLSKGESSGQGTVKASGLACEAECTETTALYQGPTGVAPKNKPGKTVELKATAAFGSEFSGWSGAGCSGTGVCKVTMEEAESVTATFTAKPTTTLTVNKGGEGTGAVSSKPKAINCGTTCTTQDATVPEGEAVILKEKPGTGMTFTGWSGGGCSGTAETCTVSLSGAETVTASFSGSPKPILEAKALTLTKAGSGYGTIKASGLTCEVLCTSTVSLYQGPTGVAPKNKPGKTVILKATSAPGSKTVEWSGCTVLAPTECSVTMEAAESVTATFNEVE